MAASLPGRQQRLKVTNENERDRWLKECVAAAVLRLKDEACSLWTQGLGGRSVGSWLTEGVDVIRFDGWDLLDAVLVVVKCEPICRVARPPGDEKQKGK